MSIVRRKQACPRCGAAVKQPLDASGFLCPRCAKPGPWATAEQRTEWSEGQRERRRRAVDEQVLRAMQEATRLAARRDQLAGAASLTPIVAPGFVAQEEDVYLSMAAQLAERKKQHGRLGGLSVRVPGTKSVRAHHGGTDQRAFGPADEVWQITDEGTAVIASGRIVFRGATKALEWAFTKLVVVDVDAGHDCLVLQVSNRQKAHVLQLTDVELFMAALNAARRGGFEPPTNGLEVRRSVH